MSSVSAGLRFKEQELSTLLLEDIDNNKNCMSHVTEVSMGYGMVKGEKKLGVGTAPVGWSAHINWSCFKGSTDI